MDVEVRKQGSFVIEASYSCRIWHAEHLPSPSASMSSPLPGPARGNESSMSPPTSPAVSASASAETPRVSNRRSLSRASSTSEVPQHHHYGTSYFTNFGRPSSPPPNVRKSTYGQTPRRTISAASTSRPQQQRTPSVARRDGSETVDEEDETGEEDDELTELRARARATDDGEEEDEEDGDVDPITLKQRQSLINVEHPFGLPIWKPALYKKSRSVTRHADEALHSIPSAQAEKHLLPGNIAWTVLFGWWLSLVCLVVAGLLYVVPRGGKRYARLMFGLSWYLVWPFGKFVEGNLEKSYPTDEEAPSSPTEPDTGAYSTITPRRQALNHTHSVSWVPPLTPGERTSLLSNGSGPHTVLIAPVKSYGATSSSSYDERVDLKDARAADLLGKVAFWLLLTTIIAPLMLGVCIVCWGLVFTIPMAKLNWALLQYMFSRADSIRFCAAPPILLVPEINEDEEDEEDDGGENGNGVASPTPRPVKIKTAPIAAGQVAPPSSAPTSTVLLCTYKAVGLKYYKYTVGGVNIFFINLLPVVFLVIFDAWVLLRIAERKEHAGEPVNAFLKYVTSRSLIFAMSLLSVIPLSYFLGMAVASISAQSSIGMGAVINATFGSIIEIILYGIALTQGKGRLVEGSIIGSLLAGVLLMPGMSMVSGATKKKEMKFNAQSAGVTSTMLIMAIIGTLTPTLFYQTYGNVRVRKCLM
jgi:Ca2+:H+ antiporter